MSAKDRDEVVARLLRDPKFLRAAKGLCPKKGDGTVAISTPGGKPVTLTPETREKIDRALREGNAAEEGEQP